ncbi:tyrosine-type recombinase/integrase [Asticcacaulis sp.]|uniref:tyrosine-type recombinase/integrase n=1 Tax=Asticcacaulis sp. TaxID=1872648 RepID=UPI00391B64F5
MSKQSFELYQREGTENWMVRYYQVVEGQGRKLVRKSTGTSDRDEAERVARKLVRGQPVEKQPKAKPVSDGQVILVSQLFETCRTTIWKHHKSKETLRSTIKILNAMCGHESIKAIDRAYMESMKAQLQPKYAESTIRRKLEVLSSALRHATHCKHPDGTYWLESKPMLPKFDINNNRERVISQKEEAAIYAAMDARIENEPTRAWRTFKIYYMWLQDTLGRKSEILAVNDSWLEEYKPGKWVLNLPGAVTKNGRPHTVPLTERLVATLPKLRATMLPNGNFFPFKPAQAWRWWSTVRADVKKQSKGKINVDDVWIHTTRHTSATRLLKDPRNKIEFVSKMLNHSSIAITLDRYAHVQLENKQVLADSLDAMNEGRGLD